MKKNQNAHEGTGKTKDLQQEKAGTETGAGKETQPRKAAGNSGGSNEIDRLSKELMKSPEISADLINLSCYGGEHVIEASMIVQYNPEMGFIPGETEILRGFSRSPDLLFGIKMQEELNTLVPLFLVEAQTDPDPTIVVRLMGETFMLYHNQILAKGDEHQANNFQDFPKDLSQSERRGYFKARFYHTDQLIPVIPMVVYWNKQNHHKCAHSLHELLVETDPELRQYIPDFKVIAISPHDAKDEELMRIQSDLGITFQFIKYADKKVNKQFMMDLAGNHPVVRQAAFQLIKKVVGLRLPKKMETIFEQEETVNMKSMFDMLLEDERAPLQQELKEVKQERDEIASKYNDALRTIKELNDTIELLKRQKAIQSAQT